MDLASFHEIDHHQLYDHLYALYTEHRPRENQHLGYVDKSTDLIDITLPLAGADLTVRQSLASLSSTTQLSSTGFICWQTALYFADWAVAHPKSPLKGRLSDKIILELGAGVSSVLASVLGPRLKHYVASDQGHILKMLRENFGNNVVSQKYTSTTTEKGEKAGPRRRVGVNEWSKIDFVELDWESPEQGILEFQSLTGQQSPDYVFACDTIYNSYLVPYFVATMKMVMSAQTVGVVAMQLRDEAITEEFLEEVYAQGMRVFQASDEIITDELRQGFVVYFLKRRP